MDPLSHAVTGSLLAQSAARPSEIRAAAVVGALAGMTPDLDILIQSSTDSLLQVEFHRHFSHALIFVPVGALLCALVGYPVFRRWLSFGRLYLYSFLGYLQGGILDACTSYGTRLWWPFSETRVAWSNIAIIDPLYTIPGLILAIWAAVQRKRLLAWGALAWLLLYLLIGVVQRERAISAGEELAASRGLVVERIEAKPSVFNNFLFRVVVKADDRLYVDAIRVGWFSRPVIYEGTSVPRLQPDELFSGAPEGSQLRRDIERFTHFSDRWVYFVEDDPAVIGDFRYALLPDSVVTLWTLQVDRNNPNSRGGFVSQGRDLDDHVWARFAQMLRGEPDELKTE